MSVRVRRRVRRGGVLTALGFVLLGSCNLYEGRTLDFFEDQGPSLVTECEASPDCPRDRPACARGACVECRGGGDCAANQGCNPLLLSCALSCAEASQCAGQPLTMCSPELDVCVECVIDSDCREPRRPACQPGGRCAECTSDAHCPLDRPHCQASTHTCEECLDASQCESGVCDLRDGRCVECLSDAECGGGTCDVGPRRCRRPCVGPADCEPRRPLCDLGSGACIQCNVDQDCSDPKRPACGLEHECAECTNDAHCTEPNQRACITGTQRCGECTSDAYCSAMQRCDLERAACVPATMDEPMPPAPIPEPMPEPMPEPTPGPAPPGP